MHALIEQWRQCCFDTPPFFFPGDAARIKGKQIRFASHDAYVASKEFGDRADHKFHVNLLPEPYCGNLETAKVFLLSLNPGLGDAAYLGEHKPIRAALVRSIRQENRADEFPFPHLDPAFADTGGYRYWTKKLSWVIEQLKSERGLNHLETLRFLSKTIATVELCPYHSRGFPALKLRGIPSTDHVLEYVHDVLVPKATRGDIGLVVLRAGKRWDLKLSENVVVNRGTAGRSSRLGSQDDGGRLLARYLNLGRALRRAGK